MKVKFTNLKEVEEYLNHEEILCLLCFKRFSSLGNHLYMKHQVSASEYKKELGIPVRYSLLGTENKKTKSNKAKNRGQHIEEIMALRRVDRLEKMLAAKENLGQLNHDLWSEEELELLELSYPFEGIKCQKRFHFKELAKIKYQVKKLGLKYVKMASLADDKKPKSWTKKEEKIVKKYYPEMGSGCISKLPGRTKYAILSYAVRNSIRYNPKEEKDITTALFHNWSDEELEILKEWYPKEGLACIARFNGSKTEYSIWKRAYSLGFINEEKPKIQNKLSLTEEEERILHDYYPMEGAHCQKRFQEVRFTSIQINKAALGRGLKFINDTRSFLWSEHDDGILKKYYPKEGYKCGDKLESKKTKKQIQTRAGILNVPKEGFSLWSEEEVQLFKDYYPKEGYYVIKRLSSPRNFLAVKDKIKRLGLETTRNLTKNEETALRRAYPVVPKTVKEE